MLVVKIEPYQNFEEKVKIRSKNKEKQFRDLGNCLVNYSNNGIEEDLPTYQLVRIRKNKLN